MKKLTLIIIIFLGFYKIGISSEITSEVKVLQDSAKNYYLQNDFQNSINCYQEIIHKGYFSSSLYYNLGNSYYKAGDLASAIYYYEKAKLLDPGNSNINHNLKVANTQIKNKVHEIPELFFVSWYKSIKNLLPANTWAYISIILFILCLIMLILYLFSRSLSIRKTGFYSSLISLFISIISLIFAISQTKTITKNKFAIVFDSQIVKSSPQEEGTNLFEINEGLKVEILDSLYNWYNIKLPDGKEGWIYKNSVKRL